MSTDEKYDMNIEELTEKVQEEMIEMFDDEKVRKMFDISEEEAKKQIQILKKRKENE